LDLIVVMVEIALITPYRDNVYVNAQMRPTSTGRYFQGVMPSFAGFR